MEKLNVAKFSLNTMKVIVEANNFIQEVIDIPEYKTQVSDLMEDIKLGISAVENAIETFKFENFRVGDLIRNLNHFQESIYSENNFIEKFNAYIELFHKWHTSRKNSLMDILKSKLVSVILVSYNNLKYYKTAIDSVLTQDYPFMELIISDDGSSDYKEYEQEIIEYVATHENENILDFRIRTNEQNQGVTKHVNYCLKMAQGDYIFYFAIDDAIYDNTTVSEVVEFMDANDSDICTGCMAKFDEDFNQFLEKMPSEDSIKKLKTFSSKDLLNHLCWENIIMAPATKFKRSFFEKYGYYNEEYRLLEDYTKWFEITQKGAIIPFFDKIIIKYRAGGISSQPNTMLQNDWTKMLQSQIIPYIEKQMAGKQVVLIGQNQSISAFTQKNNIKGDYVITNEVLGNFKRITFDDLKKIESAYCLILDDVNQNIKQLVRRGFKYTEDFFYFIWF